MTQAESPHPPRIAPSLLSADFAQLAQEIAALEQAGADWLHLDVMDGHFVPNLTFGPPVIKSLRSHTSLPFDVHLMIETPERSVDQYVQAGADFLTVHAEATTHLHRTLGLIRELGGRPGVSLNPGTPVQVVQPVLHLVDLVLVMSVNPGFSGQKFLPEVLPKLTTLSQWIAASGRAIHLQIDGGIDHQTIGLARAAGADVFVSGSTVFGSNDYGTTIDGLKQRAATH